MHPIQLAIEAADRAITAEDFDTLIECYADDAVLVIKPGTLVRGKEQISKAFVAIADYFQHKLVVTQGQMQIIEGAGTALVIMETFLDFPDSEGKPQHVTRRATYVYHHEPDGRWLCVIDNSYGVDLLSVDSAPSV